MSPVTTAVVRDTDGGSVNCMKPEVSLPCAQKPEPDKQFHNFTAYFSKIHFNAISYVHLGLPNDLLSLYFPNKCLCAFLISSCMQFAFVSVVQKFELCDTYKGLIWCLHAVHKTLTCTWFTCTYQSL